MGTILTLLAIVIVFVSFLQFGDSDIVEGVVMFLAMTCVAIVFILGFICSIPDGISLWKARRDDPEWAKLCDAQRSGFLRWKHSKGNADWGI